MQVAPSCGQICNLNKWRHLVANFATNACGALWWSNLQLMQVAQSGGQICNWCKWCHLVAKYGTNARAFSLLTEEITQVKKAIPWVSRASGNVSFFTICLFPSISIITVAVNPDSKLIFFFTSPFVCFQSVWNNIVTVHPHLNWRQLDCHLNWTMLWQRSLIMSGFNCRNCQ